MEDNRPTPPEDDDRFMGAIGLPDDLSELPTTRYLLAYGRVWTTTTWPDESTARGEVPLQQLQDLVGPGSAMKEGWYDATGKYLGMEVSE